MSPGAVDSAQRRVDAGLWPGERRGAVLGAWIRTVCTSAIALTVGLLPAAASAQEAADGDGPKVQTIQVVERGFFLEAEFGFTAFVATLADDGDERKYGSASQIGVFAGYDVLPILSLGFGLRAMGVGVSGYLPVPAGGTFDLDELGPDPTRVQGDLYYLAPTATARFALLTTERDFLWLRADLGFALAFPGDIGGVEYAGPGLTGAFLVGYERFTKLRHFSMGISAGASMVMKPSVGIGITLLPHLKYTF